MENMKNFDYLIRLNLNALCFVLTQNKRNNMVAV